MRFRNNINNPADAFILKYVVYHYYRSQGWIVKEGIKYGVDYGKKNINNNNYKLIIMKV